MYTESSINRVREADIVTIIGHYCELKKAGANYNCLSPFIKEKTASCIVSPVKQIFKDFSSGNGGDGIKFVMLYEKVEFIEAVEIIAKICNIILDKEEQTAEQVRKHDHKKEMAELSLNASLLFKNNYRELPKNYWAKKMIAERGFTEETCIDFQIGYAGTENQIYKTVSQKGQLAIAKEIGLCKTNNNNTYDCFKNRIIFPILNDKGGVVGFGGRRQNGEAFEKYPKYYNSIESPLYDKSRILYGLFQSRKAIYKKGFAILSEGYTDVISCHQHGADTTVATCGTSLTEGHLKLLKRYTDHIILFRDGDTAGHNATIKDIDSCLEEGFTVSVCLLPEGDDPDSYARKQKNIEDWILKTKIDGLLWKAELIIKDINRDNYQRDIDDITELYKIQVSSLQEEIKDDAFLAELKGSEKSEAKKINTKLRNEIQQALKYRKNEIDGVERVDPNKKAKAVDLIGRSLFLIKKEIKRAEYIKQVGKIINVTPGTLKIEIGNLEKAATDALKRSRTKVGIKDAKLPQGADRDEYYEHGFVTLGNTYYFQSSHGSFFKGTNFKMEALYHVEGDKENKRLCELINEEGVRRLVDFDSETFVSFLDFRKKLVRLDNFVFYTANGTRTEHFDRFSQRILKGFDKALELLTMGWNKKGFYAFADGAHYNGKFQKVNKYGIMYLDGVDQDSDEYNRKIDCYYSPAFSVMHRKNQDGDDRYENDRMFVYRESTVTLNEWMDQMIKVFPGKGELGILFNFASIFRDLFLTNFDSFPLLGGFGEKDSGKSAFGKILQDFFYYNMPALDLTQATHVGFSRRLSRNINTVQFLDEYQDAKVDGKVFSGIMGGWNGMGREKGMNTGDKRTTYDKVNSAIYYAGQFLPTRMENALATRTMALIFPSVNFTAAQKEEFNKLLNWTKQGMSSLVVEIVNHRNYFESELPLVYAETVRSLKTLLNNNEYQERIFGNVAQILTAYTILKEKIDFPFTQAHFTEICKSLIIDNSEAITDSNGLTEFWNILQRLFELNFVQEGMHYDIQRSPSIRILRKREKITWKNPDRKRILFLRLNAVHQYYANEISRREGVEVIGETTLRNYLKSRQYFIGLVPARRFGNLAGQSCYAFDYDILQEKNIVTLQREGGALPGAQTPQQGEPVQPPQQEMPY